ncbi:hypothetical protein CR513_36047, partial [Mucuna pruriens]
MNKKWIINEHNKTFLNWFKGQILNVDTVSETIKWLAHKPNAQDNKSIVQNISVMVVAKSMHLSTSKDKNPVMTSICYFRLIEETQEINYTKYRVFVFKCKWVDSNAGVQIDELGFTLVNLDKVGYKGESFIMTSHVNKCFISMIHRTKGGFVRQRNNMHGNDENQDISLDLTDTPSFSTHMPTFDDENEVDDVHDVHVTCHNHIGGLWENIVI